MSTPEATVTYAPGTQEAAVDNDPRIDVATLGDVYSNGSVIKSDGTYEIEIVVVFRRIATQRFIGHGSTRTGAFSDAIWQAKRHMDAHVATNGENQ